MTVTHTVLFDQQDSFSLNEEITLCTQYGADICSIKKNSKMSKASLVS